MGLVAIQEQNLIDIGNSLRGKLGETKVVYSEELVPLVKVSKTPNAKSLTEYDNEHYAGRGAGITDTITIEGATKLRVIMAYQTFSKYSDDYISVTEGTVPNTSHTYQHRYYGKELNTVELVFNGDTVTFYLRTLDAEADRRYLGYYAEVRGCDADDNFILGIEGEKVVKNDFRAQDMASAIDSIIGRNPEEVPTDEELVVGGNCTYKFSYDGWNWFIEKYKDRITTKDITSAERMFNSNTLDKIPFKINFKDTTKDTSGVILTHMFYDSKITEAPLINIPNAEKAQMNSLFMSSNKVSDLNGVFENEDEFFASWQGYKNTSEFGAHYIGATFNGCSRLRTVPTWFYKFKLNPESTAYLYTSYSIGYRSFYSCSTLDEIIGFPIWHCTVPLTKNMFDGTFDSCYRIKDIIFETNEDGTPIVTDWKSQVITLTSNIGYTNSAFTMTAIGADGITADMEMKNDATYQALKDNPNCFATNVAYSRYNHDSAVRTIQSLPDTSAYLASAGGTNTIKFTGKSGSSTDGGAINTLTAEEIAIATAKGWTVSIV